MQHDNYDYDTMYFDNSACDTTHSVMKVRLNIAWW